MLDANVPFQNPELIKAIENFYEENNVQTQNDMIEAVLQAKYLVPVQMDPKPEVDENGISKITPQTMIKFHSVSTSDDKVYFLAFTDWDEVHKWNKSEGQDTIIFTFDDYAYMILKNATEAAGFIINPFGVNMMFPKEIIEQIVMINEEDSDEDYSEEDSDEDYSDENEQN